MSLFRTATCLPLLVLISCGITKPYQSERPLFRERDASFFIVSEKQMSSWDKARVQCPIICEEEGGYWTGSWSGQSPLVLESGTCECSSSAAEAVATPEAIAASSPMSMEEMKAAFDVPATPQAEPSREEIAQSAPVNKPASTKTNGATRTVSSSANAGGDVSATVVRDPKTGTVTATAQAGRARAQSRSVSTGEVSATITRDPKTGTVTATATAGNATATSVSRKDPFDI